jgi:hypothetical protein
MKPFSPVIFYSPTIAGSGIAALIFLFTFRRNLDRMLFLNKKE